MFRLMLGFVAGLALGCNCSKLALRTSGTLRRLADRLDRVAREHEHVHEWTAAGGKETIFRAAA